MKKYTINDVPIMAVSPKQAARIYASGRHIKITVSSDTRGNKQSWAFTL